MKNIWDNFINSIATYNYTDLFEKILSNSFQILIILVIAWLLLKGRVIIIRRIFDITRLPQKKEDTLASLLLSLTRYVIILIAIITILPYLGVDMRPVLASAGVLGLAVGFGAQNLFKDIIAGFFIMFEDWMHVGDYVKIGDISGTVEEIGLRSTVVREWSGKQVHLLNSSITKLVNYNREKMRPIVSFNIPYEYPSDEVKQVIEKACDFINHNYKEHLLTDINGIILEPVQLYGITDVENQALGAKYTIIGLVKDTSYWLMSKEIRRITLEYFLENHIKVAYPKRIYENEPSVAEEL